MSGRAAANFGVRSLNLRTLGRSPLYPTATCWPSGLQLRSPSGWPTLLVLVRVDRPVMRSRTTRTFGKKCAQLPQVFTWQVGYVTYAIFVPAGFTTMSDADSESLPTFRCW